jgi:hypothetical protein
MGMKNISLGQPGAWFLAILGSLGIFSGIYLFAKYSTKDSHQEVKAEGVDALEPEPQEEHKAPEGEHH